MGEDARDEAEITAIKVRGHLCSTDKADYLVHLYEEQGERFLETINGGFSGVLMDYRRRRTFLFNDRFGLNRLYYHENDKGLFFSSEAKPLLRVFPQLRSYNYKSLGQFFSWGCVLDNNTLFSDIRLIPGGSLWSFVPGGKSERSAYFQRTAWEEQAVLSDTQFYDKLSDTWARILPRYFHRREKTAISLNGSLSSRLIMAWAPCPPYRVPCFTTKDLNTDSVDLKIARSLARCCQQHHEAIEIKRNFFSEFPALAKKAINYTDGARGVRGAVDLYISKLVREIAPVYITDHFGEQIFNRNIGLRPLLLDNHIFERDFLARIQKDALSPQLRVQMNSLSVLAFLQIPFSESPRLALANTQLAVRLPSLDIDLMRTVYQTPADNIGYNRPLCQLIFKGFPALKRLAFVREGKRRFLSLGSILRQYFGGAGLQMASARKDDYQFQSWYRGPLSNYVKDILLDPRTLERPYLNKAGVESLVHRHIAGEGDFAPEISSLLTCELVQRQLMRSSDA